MCIYIYISLVWAPEIIIAMRADKTIMFGKITQNGIKLVLFPSAAKLCHLAEWEVTSVKHCPVSKLFVLTWCVFTGILLGRQKLFSMKTWVLCNYNNTTPCEYTIMDIFLKSWCLFNERVPLPTRGSGDPSSGCTCNTAGSQVSVIESHLPARMQYILCGLLSIGAILITNWTMVTSIRLQQLAAVTEADCWGDTGSSITQTSADSPNTWPQTNKVTGVKWALRAARQSRPLLESRISGGVYCTVPPELVRV